jgi:ElaB/YqjD/DUF883 family membrane-anchored ribosome-binding protein
MSQETLLYVMAAAVVVSAAAIVVQLILLFGTFFAVRETRTRFLKLSERVESFLDLSSTFVEQSRTEINEITTKTKDLLSSAQAQVTRLDVFLDDATTRARAQMDHVELVVDDTLTRIQETSAVLQKGVLQPLRQLNALAAGVQAALEYLSKRHRKTVERATQEDEMFI